MIAATGHERWVWDCYRRFIQMYGDVVKGVKMALFDQALVAAKAAAGVKDDHELGAPEVRQAQGHVGSSRDWSSSSAEWHTRVAGSTHSYFHPALSSSPSLSHCRLLSMQLKALVGAFKTIYRAQTGADVPEDPRVQVQKKERAASAMLT